jgi:23S rRNA (guanosine2251-2'-O)-methyltransferase
MHHRYTSSSACRKTFRPRRFYFWFMRKSSSNAAPQPRDTIVYGIHPVEELILGRPGGLDRVYFEKDRKSAPLFQVLKLCRRKRLPYQVIPTRRLDSIAGTNKHQGVAALCPAREYTPIEEVLSGLENPDQTPLLVVAAGVEDPRNLGSLIRSCAGLGAGAVLLEQRNTAPLGSTVAKTAAGMLEHVRVSRPRNLERVVGELKQRGVLVVGADARACTRPDQVDLTKPTVLITGGEHRGIPPYLRKLCDLVVGIPLQPGVESLNVAVAGAILLYETRRQRARAT